MFLQFIERNHYRFSSGPGGDSVRFEHYVEDLGRQLDIVVDELGRMDTLPHVIVIEPTNRCNMNCAHCHHEFLTKSGLLKLGDMSFATFSRVVPILKKAALVSFTGFGEPYLAKNLYGFISVTSGSGVKTALTTNGFLLNELSITRSIEAGLDYLEISIDGLAVNKKFRGIDGRILMKKIQHVTHMRRKMGQGPSVSVATVLSNSVLDELTDLVELAAYSGADEVRLQPMQVFLKSMERENIYRDTKRAAASVEKAMARAEDLGISVVLRRSTLKQDERYSVPRRYMTSYHPDMTCIEPFSRFYVGWDGRTYMCCGGLESGLNVNDMPPALIWNAKPYMELRQSLLSGNLQPRCQVCNQIHGSLENQRTLVDSA